jgi:hypothetical protein
MEWRHRIRPGPPTFASQHRRDLLHFRSQLLALLGVESLPTGVELAKTKAGDLSPLSGSQLDALLRRRMKENVEGTSQTLRSIVSPVETLENIPVGMDIQGDVLQQNHQNASASA